MLMLVDNQNENSKRSLDPFDLVQGRTFARNDNAHGNLRGPPPNGFAGGEAAVDVDVSSAVTTESPCFKPSITSVTTPSLMPVLICTGRGELPAKA